MAERWAEEEEAQDDEARLRLSQSEDNGLGDKAELRLLDARVKGQLVSCAKRRSHRPDTRVRPFVHGQ